MRRYKDGVFEIFARNKLTAAGLVLIARDELARMSHRDPITFAKIEVIMKSGKPLQLREFVYDPKAEQRNLQAMETIQRNGTAS